MAISIETLIANRQADITGMKGAVDNVYNAMIDAAMSTNPYGISVALPGVKLGNGTVLSALDFSSVIYPTFTAPAKPTITAPVLNLPETRPDRPTINDLPTLTPPPVRVAKEIKTDDLFLDPKPIINLPDLAIDDPDLQLPRFLAEMDAIAKPILSTLTYPSMTPVGDINLPDVDTPSYESAFVPQSLEKSKDYATEFQASYSTMIPALQSWIDQQTDAFISRMAPGYHQTQNLLESSIARALSGQGALPDALDDALYIRAEGRINDNYEAEERSLRDNFQKSGFIHAPGALTANLHDLRMKRSAELAKQANEIYIDRANKEFQFMQFAMQMGQALCDGVRNSVIQYATSTVLAAMQEARAYAEATANLHAKTYDHAIARANFDIAVLDALQKEYDTRLKASLAGYESLNKQLEVLRTRSDVEFKQIQAVEMQSQAEYRQVQWYQAMIDAISRKSDLTDKQLKLVEIQGRIFGYKIENVKAGHDLYLAALEGDDKRLKARMTENQVIRDQLAADEASIKAQQMFVDAVASKNKAAIDTYRVDADLYNLEADAALKAFTGGLDLARLSESLYATSSNTAVQQYEALNNLANRQADMLTKAYQLSIETELKNADLKIRARDIVVDAYQSELAVLGNALSTAYSALQSNVSAAFQAAG